MLLCKFCNQERKNKNSLRNHERLCKSNLNRQTTPFQDLSFQQTKNNKPSNQHIKAKELGTEYIVSAETRKKISDSTKSRSAEFCKNLGLKVSATVQKKVKEGSWHTSLAKHMHIDYNGVDLHGSWEVAYAKYLDENKINWIRNKDSFTYTYNGKDRRYTPDFYLVDKDEYVEIKGYKTEKDDAKWSQFPKHRTLTVLMKKELKALGII